jgi:hypothetical protein
VDSETPTFGVISQRVLGRPLKPPIGSKGERWLYMGQSPLACSECPWLLSVAVSNEGSEVILCSGCRDAWPLTDYDDETIRVVREFVASHRHEAKSPSAANRVDEVLRNKRAILDALARNPLQTPRRKVVKTGSAGRSRGTTATSSPALRLRCHECLREKPLKDFPSHGGYRCLACGGQERGRSVRTISGGLPTLGKHR